MNSKKSNPRRRGARRRHEKLQVIAGTLQCHMKEGDQEAVRAQFKLLLQQNPVGGGRESNILKAGHLHHVLAKMKASGGDGNATLEEFYKVAGYELRGPMLANAVDGVEIVSWSSTHQVEAYQLNEQHQSQDGTSAPAPSANASADSDGARGSSVSASGVDVSQVNNRPPASTSGQGLTASHLGGRSSVSSIDARGSSAPAPGTEASSVNNRPSALASGHGSSSSQLDGRSSLSASISEDSSVDARHVTTPAVHGNRSLNEGALLGVSQSSAPSSSRVSSAAAARAPSLVPPSSNAAPGCDLANQSENVSGGLSQVAPPRQIERAARKVSFAHQTKTSRFSSFPFSHSSVVRRARSRPALNIGRISPPLRQRTFRSTPITRERIAACHQKTPSVVVDIHTLDSGDTIKAVFDSGSSKSLSSLFALIPVYHNTRSCDKFAVMLGHIQAYAGASPHKYALPLSKACRAVSLSQCMYDVSAQALLSVCLQFLPTHPHAFFNVFTRVFTQCQQTPSSQFTEFLKNASSRPTSSDRLVAARLFPLYCEFPPPEPRPEFDISLLPIAKLLQDPDSAVRCVMHAGLFAIARAMGPHFQRGILMDAVRKLDGESDSRVCAAAIYSLVHTLDIVQAAESTKIIALLERLSQRANAECAIAHAFDQHCFVALSSLAELGDPQYATLIKFLISRAVRQSEGEDTKSRRRCSGNLQVLCRCGMLSGELDRVAAMLRRLCGDADERTRINAIKNFFVISFLSPEVIRALDFISVFTGNVLKSEPSLVAPQICRIVSALVAAHPGYEESLFYAVRAFKNEIPPESAIVVLHEYDALRSVLQTSRFDADAVIKRDIQEDCMHSNSELKLFARKLAEVMNKSDLAASGDSQLECPMPIMSCGDNVVPPSNAVLANATKLVRKPAGEFSACVWIGATHTDLRVAGESYVNLYHLADGKAKGVWLAVGSDSAKILIHRLSEKTTYNPGINASGGFCARSIWFVDPRAPVDRAVVQLTFYGQTPERDCSHFLKFLRCASLEDSQFRISKDEAWQLHHDKFPVQIRRWHMGDHIGAGSFANVWSVMNRKTGEGGAMKQSIFPVSDLERGHREMAVLEKFRRSRRVLGLLDFDERRLEKEDQNGREYVLISLIFPELACTLQTMLERRGRFGLAETRHFAYEIFRAIEELHTERVWHRDLKTDNILADSLDSSFPQWHVGDLGLASIRSCDGVQLASSNIAYSEYRAPENHTLDGLAKSFVSAAMDFWSCGCIIYEVFTGVHPYEWYFQAANTRELPVDARRGVLVESYNKDLLIDCGAPPELVELIEGLLESDPTERLGTKRSVFEASFFNGYKPVFGREASPLHPPNSAPNLRPVSWMFDEYEDEYNADVSTLEQYPEDEAEDTDTDDGEGEGKGESATRVSNAAAFSPAKKTTESRLQDQQHALLSMFKVPFFDPLHVAIPRGGARGPALQHSHIPGGGFSVLNEPTPGYYDLQGYPQGAGGMGVDPSFSAALAGANDHEGSLVPEAIEISPPPLSDAHGSPLGFSFTPNALSGTGGTSSLLGHNTDECDMNDTDGHFQLGDFAGAPNLNMTDDMEQTQMQQQQRVRQDSLETLDGSFGDFRLDSSALGGVSTTSTDVGRISAAANRSDVEASASSTSRRGKRGSLSESGPTEVLDFLKNEDDVARLDDNERCKSPRKSAKRALDFDVTAARSILAKNEDGDEIEDEDEDEDEYIL